MPWRRHNRHITHQLFYDGTSIDGSRLEDAMGDIEDRVNSVAKGDTKQRFVAVQYHGGFQPEYYGNAVTRHNFPWLKALNVPLAGAYNVEDTGGTPLVPPLAPYNVLRVKGSAVPGVESNAGIADFAQHADKGQQFAWTRVFHFSRPVIVEAMSVLMHVDPGDNVVYPYTGTVDPDPASGTYEPPYSYDGTIPGTADNANTQDVVIVMDVCSAQSPEDSQLNDVEFTRHRWVVNDEPLSLIPPSPTAVGWTDMRPHFDSIAMTGVRPLSGRIIEHSGLNIPVHEGARLRMSILIPDYAGGSDVAPYGPGSWGTKPWYLQAWSTTITVLEEVQSL